MKRVLSLFLLSASLMFGYTSLLQAKTFVREYSYRASEADSKITARSIALNQLKTQLLQEIGVYIESNFEDTAKESKAGIEQLSKQQIVSITAGVTETKILEEKWDGQTYYMKAKIDVDIDDVSKRIQEIAKDRDKTRELEEVKKKADEAFRQIELLQVELSKTKDEKEKLKFQAEYNKRSDDLTVVDWYQMGNNALELKEYDKAIKYYQKVISTHPKYFGPYNNMGLAYASKEEYGKAIELYEKAVSINPKYFEAYYNMGLAYAKIGEQNEAIEQYEKAININPKHAEAYYNTGLAYSNTGNQDKAIEMCEKAININPMYASAYSLIGFAYGKKENYDKAILYFQKAININPRDATSYGGMGGAYQAKGDNDEAVNCLRQAARLGSEEAQKLLNADGIDW